MISIPGQNQWKTSVNDMFGNIFRTKNLYLRKKGYAGVSRPATVLYSQTDDSNFATPVCITSDQTYAYVITTDHAFTFDLASNSLTSSEITTSGSPSLGFDSDCVIYQGLLHVSGGTTVKSYSGGTGGSWTSRITGLSSSYPHPLCVSEHQNYLAVGDANTVLLYDTTYSLNTTLTIPSEYAVTGIRWRANSLYIATRHLFGGDAKLFVWSGLGTAAQYGFPVHGDWIYSLCEHNSSIVLVSSNGQLLRFNGGGFDVLANFPVYESNFPWISSSGTSSLVGNVASRGMVSDGEVIFINVNGDLAGSQTIYPGKFIVEQPGGIWQYREDVGLFHAAGYNYLTKLSLAAIDLNSNALTFASAHQALTGDPVLMSSQSTLTGLTAGQVYYAVPGSTTVTKLALSPADAFAGRTITIGGSVSTDTFQFNRYESTGADRNLAGGIMLYQRAQTNLFYGTQILWGGRPYDATNSNIGALMSFGMGRNRGYLVTSKINSSQIKDFFKRMEIFFDNIGLDTDQIVIKYRTGRKFGLPAMLAFSSSATWTSSTTFTVDSTIKDIMSIAVGNEIEVVQGAGAGYLAHITTITNVGTTYTFTIDETMPVSSGSFDFVADNWIKGPVISNTSDDTYAGFFDTSLDKLQAKWIEFKIELRGRGVMIQEIQIDNSTKQ